MDHDKPKPLIWTDRLDERVEAFLSAAENDFRIVCPFIASDVLRWVLRNVGAANVHVITTWRTRDAISGVSDLAIYPYLRSRGSSLSLHPRLHAKAFVTDDSEIIITSANLSRSALGLSKEANVECAVKIETIGWHERVWLASLFHESIKVTDQLYEAFRAHVEDQRLPLIGHSVAEFDFQAASDCTLQLATLPQSQTPSLLLDHLEAIESGRLASGDDEYDRTIHDASLFKLDLGRPRSELNERLRVEFFSIPLVSTFAEFARPWCFFGQAKAWLQENCTDFPTPRRSTLTSHVRKLFDWLVELGAGTYSVTRPRYSERLATRSELARRRPTCRVG